LEETTEEHDLGGIWFQQDGVTAHTAQNSLVVSRQMFPTRLVSNKGDGGWPTRSPDLSMCDVFLRGYVKEKVFKHRPHTLEDPKEQTAEGIRAMPIETKVSENFRNRLQKCIAADGRHLSDIIFEA